MFVFIFISASCVNIILKYLKLVLSLSRGLQNYCRKIKFTFTKIYNKIQILNLRPQIGNRRETEGGK